jgi:CTP-dependent riboflavin kinase
MGDQKQLLINTIKEWVSINSKEVSLQKQLKELKTSKKQLSDTLIKVMENNEIDRFDINNGKLSTKIIEQLKGDDLFDGVLNNAEFVKKIEKARKEKGGKIVTSSTLWQSIK